MKKYLVAILFLLMSTSFARAQTPFDLIYHSIPISPTIDIPEEIKQIGANVQTATSQAKKIIMTFKTDASSIQAAITSTFNKIKSGAILDILGNPGQAKPGFCGKELKNVKTKNVAKKVKQVLLVSESDDFIHLTKKNAVKEKFFMDNVYAIYAASLILHQEVENDIKAQIDKAKECATSGDGTQCGVPSTDGGGNNEAIFMYGKTLETLDSVVRLWESVSALKAKLAAIKIIRNIKPTVDNSMEDSSDEQAFLNQHEAIAEMRSATQIGFAQIKIDDLAKSMKNTSIENVDAASVVKKESETIQYVNSSVDFVSPDISESENALASVQDQMDTLNEMNEVEGMVQNVLTTHNLIKDMPQYKDQAQAYLDVQEEHKKALNKMVESEKCAIKYLSKYFQDAHKVWSGNLQFENAAKHDLRKGISGWAINAFEVLKSGEATDAINAFVSTKDKQFSTSKDEEDDAYLTDSDALDKKLSQSVGASGNNPDDLAQDTLSEEEVSSMEDDPDFEKAQNSNSEDKNNELIGDAASSNKKKKSAEEARKASLLSWQVGAEASKMLGDTSNNWGSALTDNKLIWNDTKKFYKKYLELKYNNILQYMKSYSEADILSLVAAKLEGDTQKVGASKYQIDRREKLVELQKDFETKLATAKENLYNKIKTYDVMIEAKNKELEPLRAESDEYVKSLREKKEEINAIKEAAKEQAFNQVSSKYTAELKFPVGDEAPTTTKVVTLDKDKDSEGIKGKLSTVIKESAKIIELEKEVKSLKTKIKNLDKKIAKAEDELNDLMSKRQSLSAPSSEDLLVQNAEAEFEETLRGADGRGGALGKLHSEAKNIAVETIKSVLIASNEENPIEGFDVNEVISKVEDAGRSIVNAVHNKADEIIVQNGLNKLYSLGDDLFSEQGYSKVTKIHDEIINNLKTTKFTFELVQGTISPLLIMRDLVVMNEFLDGIDTSSETDGFFVGRYPKEKDLKAPFELKGFDLPPLREVFHFDSVDFKNIQPDQKLTKEKKSWYKKSLDDDLTRQERFVIKEDFLNYGGEIPKIWVKMLEDFPFIETRLPLKEILGNDGRCENIYFSRAGVFPCAYGPNTPNRFLDINHRNKFINSAIGNNHKDLNRCPSEITSELYHKFWEVGLVDDYDRTLGVRTDKNFYDEKFDWVPKRECEYSELGLLFESDDHNNLYLRKVPYKNFKMVSLKDEIDKKKWSKDDATRNMAKAQYSEYSRNQIGDFLKHAEKEKTAQESLDEVKAEYNKNMESLYELFNENGFTPTKEFFLAYETDYNQAIKVLKDVKKKKIEAALVALNAVNTKDNKPAQEKSENLRTLLNFMNKDEDSLLRLSMIDATKKDLDARLKKEKADKGLRNKFKDKNKGKKDEYSDSEEVYCATY